MKAQGAAASHPAPAAPSEIPKPAAFLPYLLSGPLPGLFFPRRRSGVPARHRAKGSSCPTAALHLLLLRWGESGKCHPVALTQRSTAASHLGQRQAPCVRGIELGGRRRRREWCLPVCKHLPQSSLEEALPLFELEVGTRMALNKQGSAELGAMYATSHGEAAGAAGPPLHPGGSGAWPRHKDFGVPGKL